MVDTLPPKSYRPRKFLDRESPNGTKYKSPGGYICDNCSCNDQQIAKCLFQRNNIDGIRAAFSPDKLYRRRHRKDIPDSPLMQGLLKDPRLYASQELPVNLNPQEILRTAAVVHPKLSQIVAPTANNLFRLQRKLADLVQNSRR